MRRDRVARTAAAICALVLVYRGVIFAISRLWQLMPLPFFGPFGPDTEPTFDLISLYLYLSFFARLGPLCLGVLAALAATNVSARQFITR